MKTTLYILISLLLTCAACSDDKEPIVPGPARPSMNPQDSLAIVAYYHSMKCAEWKEGFHWDLKDYTTWGGVTAMLDASNNEYRITGIEVPQAKTYLPDGYSLPAELGNLPYLRSLIVWGDGRAVGGIPPEVFNCPLEVFYITGQEFTKASLPSRVLSDSFLSYPIVNKGESSLSNPDLIDDWENVDIIALNTSKEGGNQYCTVPWSNNGTSSELPESFRKDIRKEAGWSMPFHTFKKQNIPYCPNYLCFSNATSNATKVFYYHDNSNVPCYGPRWFPMTSDGEDIHLLKDTETVETLFLFSNPLNEQRLNIGWHGFMIETPLPDNGKADTQIRLETPSDNPNQAS